MFKTFSTNQRDIKLITDKFAITEEMITRQTTNVSSVVIINCQDVTVSPCTSKMDVFATVVNSF